MAKKDIMDRATDVAKAWVITKIIGFIIMVALIITLIVVLFKVI